MSIAPSSACFLHVFLSHHPSLISLQAPSHASAGYSYSPQHLRATVATAALRPSILYVSMGRGRWARLLSSSLAHLLANALSHALCTAELPPSADAIFDSPHVLRLVASIRKIGDPFLGRFGPFQRVGKVNFSSLRHLAESEQLQLPLRFRAASSGRWTSCRLRITVELSPGLIPVPIINAQLPSLRPFSTLPACIASPLPCLSRSPSRQNSLFQLQLILIKSFQTNYFMTSFYE